MFSGAGFSHDVFTLPVSEDFRVYIGGEEIPVYTCRISAYPFNRVWPGHQRAITQTEKASFVSIVSDEPITLTVTASRAHQKVLLKPYSKGITPVEKDGKITFALPENGYFVLETDDYHHCLYIFNSAPIKAPKKEDVTYYFGAGIHMPGKITLHSNESVYIDKDAYVFGCIYAKDAKNIRVFGNGLLDDSAEERIHSHCYESFTNGNIKLYDCENVKIEGVLLCNSAIWCVNIFHCFDVTLDQIKVFGQWRYNTDGVDIVNSKRVTLKNSFIHSFDDTVVIKGIRRYADTDNEDILTEGCVLWCDWGRTCELGLETVCRRYRNITFRDCDILRAGSVALDIQNGDYAEISDVLFEDIRVEYNAFDTKEVLQTSEDMVYGAEDTLAIPYLFNISNGRYHATTPAPCDADGARFATAHDIVCRRIRVYYDEAIPKTDGKYKVPIRVYSVVEGAVHENILLSDISVNGVPMTEENAFMNIKDVKNFRLETDEYAELAKNSVQAKGQLTPNQFVTFEDEEKTGLRVMFLGNSITRHGVAAAIGWHHDHGMAASAKEKDYVHILMKKIRERDENAAFCICQAAEWERNYANGSDVHERYAPARAFEADVIVMRLTENCPTKEFDGEAFTKELKAFLRYLDPAGKAKVIYTTAFWKHPADPFTRALAADEGAPLAELSDLGADPAMKALGLFEHTGVANHPGDLGMKMIAERIFEKM